MPSKNIFPRSLQYLIAVVKYGNFTHAAEALYVTQPTLSQQIKKLEDSLQSKLLDRTGKVIKLTDAGESYIKYAQLAWENLNTGERAIHDTKNLESGSLHIGLTPITDHLVCCLLEQFNSNHTNISLKLLEMPQNNIELAVLQGGIDVGIVFSNTLSNNAHSNELVIQPLFEEQLCLAVGNKNTHAHDEKISFEKFKQQPLALLDPDFILRRLIDSYYQQHDISTPNISIESNSLSMIIEIVQNGSLASILPKSIVNSQCGLYDISISPKFPSTSISLIYRKQGYKSFSCLAFIKTALNWVNGKNEKTNKLKRIPCINSK